jgi:hypothetical protein
VEIHPGVGATNILDPKPTNDLPEDTKRLTTNEYSATCIAALTSWFQLGVKRTTQEESLQKSIQCKYTENPPKKQISASWEFSHVATENVEHPQELLPRAKFLVSNNPWPSISVTITCYFSQKRTAFPQIKRGGRQIGWRDFCHETVIVMPVVTWSNHEKLHQLHLDPPEVPQHYVFDEGDSPKLEFWTSTKCKTLSGDRGRSWANKLMALR